MGVVRVLRPAVDVVVRAELARQVALLLAPAYPTISGDSVFFGPDTYRFATAVTAHLEARKTPIRRAVDICCSAGPGDILIAKAVTDTEVVMADINGAALRLASLVRRQPSETLSARRSNRRGAVRRPNPRMVLRRRRNEAHSSSAPCPDR